MPFRGSTCPAAACCVAMVARPVTSVRMRQDVCASLIYKLPASSSCWCNSEQGKDLLRASMFSLANWCSLRCRACRCISDIPDDCALDNECWTGEFKVDGKQQSFSACQDNLHAIQASPAHIVLLVLTYLHAHASVCAARYTQLPASTCKAQNAPSKRSAGIIEFASSVHTPLAEGTSA